MSEEHFPYIQTLTSDKYRSQLDRLKTGLDEKRPELANRKGAVFHQDNARHHVTADRMDIGIAWSACPTSPDILSSPCALGLLLISIHTKFS